jgi:RNA polymerase sigma-70 factor (ECF subfamily)
VTLIGSEPQTRVQAGAAADVRWPAAAAPTPPDARSLEESDKLLLARCRDGSETAFAVLVRRHERALVRHCARLVGETSALDAAQDAFIAAWSEIRSGAEIRALRPWLFTIAHRKALAQLRERRRAPVEALPETLAGGFSPDEQSLRAATVRETLTALAALPEAQRDAFVAVAVQGRSGRQVARQLGISEGTARQLVFRARATLRSAGAACLAPPVLVLRWLRRLGGSPSRVAAAARSGAVGGWERAVGTARLLKFGALAIAAGGAVGAGALQLAPSAPHAVTARERPGVAVDGNGAPATTLLAPRGSIGGLYKGLGGATHATGDFAVPVALPHAGGGAQPSSSQTARPGLAGGSTGALDPSPDGNAPPAARVADALPGVSSVVGGSPGTVSALTGAGRGAAGVSGITRTLATVGHGGVSLVTKTLAGAGHAAGSTVKHAVSSTSGLTGAVAPPVGGVEPAAGALAPVGATSDVGELPSGVVQTTVSGGSQAVGSGAGGVSTVTHTVGGAAQGAVVATGKLVQGATGAVSALGHLP